jgi:O-antigen/teichoic acid export membrane protein
MAFMLVLVIVSAILIELMVPLIVGNSFRLSIEIYQKMSLGIIGFAFSIVMAPQWITRGYFVQAAYLTFVIGVINVCVNFYEIPKVGIDGAIKSFLATSIFSVLANLIMVYHCDVVSGNRKVNK